MASCPVFQEFGGDVVRRGAGEIGMHLHAWNSPPLVSLTADDHRHQPYLMEYPNDVMADKVAALTDLLEDTFEQKMVSHGAGRWALNETYARLLVRHGYQVDCSVTPYLSWHSQRGNPLGQGGSDYRHFPDWAYWLDLDDIRREGDSSLLEVPMTISPPGAVGRTMRRLAIRAPKPVRAVVNRLWPPTRWLRPDGRNGRRRLPLRRFAAQSAVRTELNYVEFMLHSSELMPGGSPTYQTPAAIDRLYEDLETLFAAAQQTFQAATLKEYHAHTLSRQPATEVTQP
jgi:hypothetical protein